MPYQGRQPGVGVRSRFIFTASGGQTLFSGADDNGKTLAYQDGAYVDVYLNGVMLVPSTDFTATTKTSVTLTSGATASDIVEIVAYDISSIADTVSKSQGGTFDGDININGATTLNNSNADVDFTVKGDNGNALFVDGGTNDISFYEDTGATAKFFWDASEENVLLSSNEWDVSAATGQAQIRVVTPSADAGIELNAGDSQPWYIYNQVNDLFFRQDGVDYLTINTSGNVGIGTTSPLGQLHVFGTDILFENTNEIFTKIRRSGVRSTSDYVGNFSFEGGDSAGSIVSYARHLHQITNATAGSHSGSIAFTAARNGSQVSYLAIDGNSDIVAFQNSGGERMRIDSSGNLLVGTTNTDPYTSSTETGCVIKDGSMQISNDDAGSPNNAALFINQVNSPVSGTKSIRFLWQGSEVGSVTVTASSTSYNTSSDYRLKENVTPLAGAADRLAQIPVHRFNFITDPDTTVDGFIAHEVQAFVPECVTGEKDAMRLEQYEVEPAVYDAEGNLVSEAVMGEREVPDYQGIDQSKLVPLLTAALQEALTEIDKLKADVAALKEA